MASEECEAPVASDCTAQLTAPLETATLGKEHAPAQHTGAVVAQQCGLQSDLPATASEGATRPLEAIMPNASVACVETWIPAGDQPEKVAPSVDLSSEMPPKSSSANLNLEGGMDGVAAFQEEVDFSSEPIESRLASKDLNRRCSAYSEAQAKMVESDAEMFVFFGKHLQTCLGETLPKGQDAALSALATYLERCPEVDKCGTDHVRMVKAILQHKAIDKPKMQQLSLPVLLLVTEICECPPVVEEILTCLTALEDNKKKVQGFFKKQVAFIIKLIAALLEEFGVAKMSPKLGYLPVVFKYITDSDRAIKEACYSVLMELSAWKGDICGLVEPMADAQKKELEKRLAEQKQKEELPKVIKRCYRSEESLEEAMQKVPKVMEGVDAMKKLPKGWSLEKVLAMEKWKDKQAYLQQLSSALDAPTLIPSESYAGTVPVLLRLIKSESNIPVVQEAAKCIGLMARGLRKDFERPAKQCLPVLVARINDKSVWKPNVLVERVEQLLWSLPFEICFEELRPHICGKSPFAKKEATTFLLRALDLPPVQQNSPDIAQRLFGPLVAAVLPAMDDQDNLVRREAAKLLVVLASRNQGSEDVGPLLVERIPAARKNTFDEEWKKLMKEQPPPGGEGGTPLSTPSASSRPQLLPEAERPKTPRQTCRTPRSDVERSNSSSSVTGGDSTDVLFEVAPADAERACQDLLGAEVCSGFETHVSGDSILALEQWWETNQEKAGNHTGHIVTYLYTKTQGLKDSRPMVMKQILSLLVKIPKLAGKNFQPWVCRLVIGSVLEKILDKKVGATILELCLDYAESAGADRVVESIVRCGSHATVALPLLEQTFQILLELVSAFGPAAITMSIVIDYLVAHGLECARKAGQGVIKAAFALAELICSYHPKMVIQFEDAKLQDETVRKLRQLSDSRRKRFPTPSRGPSAGVELDTESLVPRQLLGNVLNMKEVMSKLQAPASQERIDALQTLHAVLSRRCLLTKGLGELVGVLRSHIQHDTHMTAKRLVLEVVGLLACAVGKEGKPFAKALLQPVLVRMGDKDKAVRSAAKGTSRLLGELLGKQSWASIVRDVLLEPGEDLREAILEQLGEVLLEGTCDSGDDGVISSDVKEWKTKLITPLFACCLDSKRAVRTDAERLLLDVLLPELGTDQLQRCAGELRMSEQQGLPKSLCAALGLPEPNVDVEDADTVQWQIHRTATTDGRHSFSSAVSGMTDDSVSGGRRPSDVARMQEMRDEITMLRSMVEKLEHNAGDRYIQQPQLQELAAAEPRRMRAASSERVLQARSSSLRPASPQRCRAASPGPAHSQSQTFAPSSRSRMLTPRSASCERTRPRPRAASAERTGYGMPPSTPPRATASSTNRPATPPRRCPSATRVRAPSNDNSSNRDRPDPRQGEDFEVQRCIMEVPRVSKVQRQQRERSQYWGIDDIVSEYLAALKEQMKGCISERLWKQMFSDRMNEQLLALQTWKVSLSANFEAVVEILDMMLKWLTWMLTNTNTQVWKSSLDVLSCILEQLEAVNYTLTEREAQILIPTLIERVGHNLLIFRDFMVQILHRLPGVYPRGRLIPMMLRGMSVSKNKKSVADILHVLSNILDRQTVAGVSKSQKDLTLIVKLLDDKDADVRKNAASVMVTLSQHVDSVTFSRICKPIGAVTMQGLRVAIKARGPAKVDAVGIGAEAPGTPSRASAAGPSTPSRHRQSEISMLNASVLSEVEVAPTQVSRKPAQASQERNSSNAQASATRIPRSPSKNLTPREQSALTRAASEKNIAEQRPVAARAEPPRTPERHSYSSGPVVPCPMDVQELLGQDFDAFTESCAEISRVLLSPSVTPKDCTQISNTLLSLLERTLGDEGRLERCNPVVRLLEEFCTSRERICALPDVIIRGLLLECLRNLHSFGWTKKISNGSEVLKKLNLACVMLFTHIGRSKAFGLLLGLELDEPAAVGSSLPLKCIRKLVKNMTGSRSPEAEVEGVLNVLHNFLRELEQKLQRPLVLQDFVPKARPTPAVDHAEEIASAALGQWPDLASAAARRYIETWQNTLSEVQIHFISTVFDLDGGKENARQPAEDAKQIGDDIGGPAIQTSQALAKARLERRLSGSPQALPFGVEPSN